MKKAVANGAARALRAVYRDTRPAVECTQIRTEGHGFEGIELLLGTSKGLLLFSNNRMTRLISGRVYGITYHEGRWYIALSRRLSLRNKLVTSQGYLVGFSLDAFSLADMRVEWCPLDDRVHQIDSWGSAICVTDTAHNCIQKFPVTENGLGRPNGSYPAGRLRSGRESENYAHINSLFTDADGTYAIFHNDSARTGRNSAIATLDGNLRLRSVRDIQASCAHNVLRMDGRFFFCDSTSGKFRNDQEVLFEYPTFLRGLARSESEWFIGGSDFSSRRGRALATGHLFRLGHGGQLLGQLRMPESGSIYEVRLVNQPDLAMSDERACRACDHSNPAIAGPDSGSAERHWGT